MHLIKLCLIVSRPFPTNMHDTDLEKAFVYSSLVWSCKREI